MNEILKALKENTPVLFSANNKGLPAIQDVENAKHRGYGSFEADIGQGINFDGGNTMNTVENGDGEWLISWTKVTGDVDAFVDEFDYNFGEVKEQVISLK